MTPSKKGRATHIKIERMKKLNLDKVAHVAGGQHKGLVINKEAQGKPLGLPQFSSRLTQQCADFTIDVLV